MSKEDIIYCIFCGEKNHTNDKKCSKCHKKLNQKDHLFKDFLYNHIKDDIKGKITDDIFSLLKGFIISNLYGTTLVATLIFATLTTTINQVATNHFEEEKTVKRITYQSRQEVEKEEKKEEVKEEVKEEKQEEKPLTNECNIKDAKAQIKTCDEGFQLENEKCIKVTYENAKETIACPEGYTYSGITAGCVKNTPSETGTKQACMRPKTMPSGVDANLVVGEEYNGSECFLVLCDSVENIVNGSCTSTKSLHKIDFTTIYTCPWEEGKDYTLKDNTCYEIILHPPYNYSCSEGVLEEKQCKIITEEKDYTLTCEAGYKYNKKCKVCEKE